MQKTAIIGNLGQDPQFRTTPNGNPVCDFSVAVNRRYTTRGGEQQEETTWFNVTCWGRLADTASKYLQKGHKVYAEGRISLEQYTARDGAARANLALTANFLEILSAQGEGSGRSAAENLPDEPGESQGRSFDAEPTDNVDDDFDDQDDDFLP